MFNRETLEEIRRIWEGIYFLKHVGAIHLFFCHPLFLVSHRKILGRWAITWPVTLTRPCTSVGHTLAFNLSFCPPQLSGVTLQAITLITHTVTGNRANEEAGIGDPSLGGSPMDSQHLVFMCCVISSNTGSGLGPCDQQIWQKEWSDKTTSLWGKPAAMLWDSQATLWRGAQHEELGLMPEACERAALAVDPLVPVQAPPHTLTAVSWESMREPEPPS